VNKRWTHDKPTEPGWYWMRYDGKRPCIQLLAEWGGRLVCEAGLSFSVISELEPEWEFCGPLSEPEEGDM
jgi:hypothetical protein